MNKVRVDKSLSHQAPKCQSELGNEWVSSCDEGLKGNINSPICFLCPNLDGCLHKNLSKFLELCGWLCLYW